MELAVPLHFGALNDAEVSHFLSIPTEVDLYSLTMQRGETIDVSVDAQQAGSALESLLRIFDAHGTPMALDDQQGGDPRLTFQAATAGTYYIGVSSAPNDDYDPMVADSGTPGGTTGLYTLDVTRIDLDAALAGHDGQLVPDGPGHGLPRGTRCRSASPSRTAAASTRATSGSRCCWARTRCSATPPSCWRRSPRAELVADATGRDFSSPAGFSVTIPAGQAPGRMDIGLRIIPDPTMSESAGLYDKSGVHRGMDWEPMTITVPLPPGATDLSQADAGLYAEVDGSLGAGPGRHLVRSRSAAPWATGS